MFSSRVSGVSLEIESDREEGLLNDVVRVGFIGDLHDLFVFIYLYLFSFFSFIIYLAGMDCGINRSTSLFLSVCVS